MSIDARLVKELREKTGAPMMNCKRALEEVGGDLEKALDHLRKLGLKKAEKKANRTATEGRIFHYIHHNGKVGVLVELNSETDFVARNEQFQEFGKELCQHVAFHDPRWLAGEEAEGTSELEREKEIFRGQIPPDKPDPVKEKILAGKVQAFKKEHCLLEQPFIKDDKKSVSQKIQELVGHIGENIRISRFVRFQIGA